MARRALREASVLLLFVATAILLTWPLARLVPIAVADPGDPLINAWILAWDVHALATAPTSVYHANLFHPAPYTLALSENLFGLWPFAAALSPFAGPIAIHNLLLIAGFAFSAWGAYVLARVIGAPLPAAFVAGLIYGFCPWRFVHLTHLQHVWGGWIPLMLAAIFWYWRRRSIASGAAVAFTALMNGLTNLHYLVFGMAAAVAVTLILLVRSRDRRNARTNAGLAAALIGPAILLLMLLWPYRIVQEMYGFRMSMDEVRAYSASLADWVDPSGPREPERRLFPGWMAYAVALGVLWRVARKRQKIDRALVAAVVLIAIGVAFSVGLHNPLYALLVEHVSALRGIRVPSRWAVLAYVGFSMLAAMSLRSARLPVVVIAAVVTVAQVFAVPIRWYLMPALPDVYRWAKAGPIGGAILELPVGVHSLEYWYVWGAAAHLRPIFNGASGGAPPVYHEVRAMFAGPHISDKAVARLRDLGGSHVIVHSDALGERREDVRRWLRESLARGDLAYVGRFETMLGGDYVFSLARNGKKPDLALTRFLNGSDFVFNEGPFGHLQSVVPGMEVRGSLHVRGWALSSRGVRRVRVWVGNKACYADAEMAPYEAIKPHFPEYSTDNARFDVTFERRPCGPPESDLLVEITDHAGRVTTLPHVWFTWRE